MSAMHGKGKVGQGYQNFRALAWKGAIFFAIVWLIAGLQIDKALMTIFLAWVACGIIAWRIRSKAKSHIKSLIRRFGGRPREFKVRILKNVDELNAFATVEGSRKAIYLTAKTIETCPKDEINFIVAHEYAHHIKDHLTVKLYSEIFSQGLMFGSYFAFKSVSNKTGAILLAIGGLAHLAKKALYKTEEYEADLIGCQLLAKAGLPASGAFGLLERIEKIQGPVENTFMGKVLNTVLGEHPPSRARRDAIVKSGFAVQ